MIDKQWDLTPLLEPQSVAIIGATERPGQSATIKNLLLGGFSGPIYPVNPGRETVFDIQCYPSIGGVPGPVDLALILVRTDSVLKAIEECHRAGVRAAVIMAEGFGEIKDPTGRQRQEALRQMSLEWGIPVCGPNCLGFVNTRAKLWAIASDAFVSGKTLEQGTVAVVSQSGGNCGNFIRGLYVRGMSPAYVISSGNEATVEASDYFDYLLDCDNVRLIAAYIEGFANPEKLRRVALKALRLGKPLLVIKIGRSERGQASALAHTGSFTGSSESYSALFKQLGIIEAEDIDDLLDRCSLFAQLPKEKWPSGNGLGVITAGGGAASILSDLAEKWNLSLPELPQDVTERLSRVTPQTITVKNPVDLIGVALRQQPELRRSYLEEFTSLSHHGLVVYVLDSSRGMSRAIQEVKSVAEESSTPIVLSTVTAEPVPEDVIPVLRQMKLPVVMGIQPCLKAVSTTYDYWAFRHRWFEAQGRFGDRAVGISGSSFTSIGGKRGALEDEAARVLLSSYGIPLVESLYPINEKEAVEAATTLGYPVVVKSLSGDVLHKSDYGLVRPNLMTSKEVVQAYREVTEAWEAIPEASLTRTVAIQPMISGGVEMYVGGSNLDTLGSLVLVGLGGVTLELTRDIVLRVAPITPFDVQEMLDSLRHAKLLQGFRKRPKADTSRLANILLAVSQLLMDHRDWVQEIDLNPVMVMEEGKGAVAVDHLVIVRIGEADLDGRVSSPSVT